MSVRILVGHVLDQLATLSEASVQTCVTSPPYYGLRAYGTEPQVWGGDPLCGHDWQDARSRGQSGGMDSAKLKIKGSDNFQVVAPQEHATCTHCTAWRGELGQEPTVAEYIDHLVTVFRAVRRVLRPDGTLWVNIGDSYASGGRDSFGPCVPGTKQATNPAVKSVRRLPMSPGLKPKDLMLVPFRFALAMQADGWYVRADIIWAKKSCMPESVTDRPTRSHEHIFLFTRQPRYYYDAEAVREDGVEPDRERNDRIGGANGHLVRHSPGGMMGGSATRNQRDVWHLGPEPLGLSHFAAFPTEIARRCISAGTSERGECPACGTAWRRVVERERLPGSERPPTTGAAKRAALGDLARTTPVGRTCGSIAVETTGWQPGCRCDPVLPPDRQMVLDPFAGAGTTGMVADRLGRDAILIELNPAYAAMAEDRVRGDAPLFAQVEVAS